MLLNTFDKGLTASCARRTLRSASNETQVAVPKGNQMVDCRHDSGPIIQNNGVDHAAVDRIDEDNLASVRCEVIDHARMGAIGELHNKAVNSSFAQSASSPSWVRGQLFSTCKYEGEASIRGDLRGARSKLSKDGARHVGHDETDRSSFGRSE